MSVSLGFPDGTTVEVASNRGWGDFVRFASNLEGADALAHLTTYGWCEGDLSGEAEQASRLADDPKVRGVAANVAAAARGQSAVVVTDGLSPTTGAPADGAKSLGAETKAQEPPAEEGGDDKADLIADILGGMGDDDAPQEGQSQQPPAAAQEKPKKPKVGPSPFAWHKGVDE